MVTTMFHHLLTPEGEHPTREENFIEKSKKKKCKVLVITCWERADLLALVCGVQL